MTQALRFLCALTILITQNLVKAQNPILIVGGLGQPTGIAVDTAPGGANIYVAESSNTRVVKLNSAGVQQQVFTTTSIGVAIDDPAGASNVYITDSGRIVKFDTTGVQQQIFTTTSPSLVNPFGVTIDASGNLYIADTSNGRVVKLNAAGIQQQIFTTTSPSLLSPFGVAVDASGNLYIADTGNNRVVKFNAAGVQQQVFTTTSPPLNEPRGIALDPASGDLYIADSDNNRIVKLNTAGVQQQIFTTSSPPLNTPFDVDIDALGNVYVADFGNNRIVVFGASSSITGDPQFVGFQGQRFQFHGIPDAYFNLISTPTFFVNSHFVYLTSGTTEIYNDTVPFSHPGTYIDQLSFVMEEVEIILHAGPHSKGFDSILVNRKSLTSENSIPGKRIPLASDSFLQVHSSQSLTITLGVITIDVANSDYFFNLGAKLNDQEMKHHGAKQLSARGLNDREIQSKISHTYPVSFQLHGLLGQTWRRIEYDVKRVYQGETDDYLVGNLLDPDFAYSLYDVKA